MPSIERPHVRLYYELSGDERGAILVLSNSLGSNLHMWDKVLPWLESKYQVLRYDMRGHGMSSVPPGPYSLGQFGRDVVLLMDSLQIERVAFCGLSLGGMVALWLGIHAPQRVSRLVLANTSARIGSRKMWQDRIAAVQDAGMESLAEASVTRWFTASYRERHPHEMNKAREMIAANDAEGYTASCAALRDADLRGEINAILAPCLVITGKDDVVTPPSDGLALHASVRHSKYVELAASHLSSWERSDEFGAAVCGFMETGERSDG